jgi:hypothetical protein
MRKDCLSFVFTRREARLQNSLSDFAFPSSGVNREGQEREIQEEWDLIGKNRGWRLDRIAKNFEFEHQQAGHPFSPLIISFQ